MCELTGTRFGDISYQSEEIVSLNDGMIGFPRLKRFIIVPHKVDSPFQWLQSVDEPAVAFLTADPFAIVQGYEPEIHDRDAKDLSLDDKSAKGILVTASIPGGKVDEMTVNLAAPIVFNGETKLGKQVILDNEAYTIKHRVFLGTTSETQKQAA